MRRAGGFEGEVAEFFFMEALSPENLPLLVLLV